MIKKWIFLLAAPVGLSAFVQTTANADNQSFLIEKLEKVNTSLSQQDPSKIPGTLRLADLLAERGRLALSQHR